MTPYQADFSRICLDCLGSGKKKLALKVCCDSCNGRRFTEYPSQSEVENITSPCPVCHGKVKVGGGINVNFRKFFCAICEGTGWIQTANPPGSLNYTIHPSRPCPECNNRDVTNRTIRLDRDVDHPEGSNCVFCNGRGFVSKPARSPLKLRIPCHKCNGSGEKTIERDFDCLRCNGTGYLS